MMIDKTIDNTIDKTIDNTIDKMIDSRYSKVGIVCFVSLCLECLEWQVYVHIVAMLYVSLLN